MIDVPTCGPGERPKEVLAGLRGNDGDEVVVLDAGGVVLGTVSLEKLRTAPDDVVLSEIMELSPNTIRPHVEISTLDEKASGVLVTTPDGVLLGALDPSAITHHGEVEEHEDLQEAMEDEVTEVMAAVEERFGDEEPDPDELRQLLRDRLLEQGRSPEEAEEVLAEVDESGES